MKNLRRIPQQRAAVWYGVCAAWSRTLSGPLASTKSSSDFVFPNGFGHAGVRQFSNSNGLSSSKKKQPPKQADIGTSRPTPFSDKIPIKVKVASQESESEAEKATPPARKSKLYRPPPAAVATSAKSSNALRATSRTGNRGASLSEPTRDQMVDDSLMDKSKEKKTIINYDYSVRPYSYLYFANENDYEVFKKYPTVTSSKLATLSGMKDTTTRPRKLSMLTRDFIDDSLYNPAYGYFARQATIYSPDKPFDYGDIKNTDDFVNRWSSTYKKYDSMLTSNTKIRPGEARAAQNPDKSPELPQLWHTPTELFQPFYGQAIARYLLLNYLITLYPYNDLVIYEVGGGNGTLMLNILDYIRETHPDVYERTRYNIIEISETLAAKQAARALQDKIDRQGFSDHVRIINKSIFDWDTKIPEPCFFIALEVFDNFAHDSIRYDHETDKPHQGYVVVDENGDFQEHFSPELDPWAEKFLTLRKELFPDLDLSKLKGHPLSKSKFRRKLRTWLDPLAHDLTVPEFIPTRYLQFLEVLKAKFPEHRLLASDFTSLPNSIPGYNSPVVQVLLNKKMITVDTYMVLQGYFDILFPTDFELAAALYTKIVGRVATVETHSAFLEQWAVLEKTMTKDGDNPMLDFYQNAAFLCT